MRHYLAALLVCVAGCAASATPDTSADEAAVTTTTGAGRPTAVDVTTDHGNRLGASILVDPPTGAGWASPAVIVRYTDTSHLHGGADAVAADVTAHFSPGHDEHATLQLRLDNSGSYMAPLFLEGLEIAVDGRTYRLGAIRPDVDDAASISSYDRVAIRGVQRAATLDDTLRLSVDLDPSAFTREEVPGYDGHGQAFALVPDGTQWHRVALDGNPHFTATVPHPDRAAIAAKGIAFGVTTNRGTIWLQDPHGNLRP
jgi:hypothetical protein